MSDLLARPIAELAARLATGALSAEALVDVSLERIAARSPSLNAFITVLGDDARRRALVLDEELRAGHYRGPLHGIPISVKDLIDMEGIPTTAASRVRADHRAAADAPVIARLRDAGAVIVGKCNLHEFALGTTSDESAFGPVHHPGDQTRSPGGSSGGSAVAVAASMCCASIGTDTGGSIRIPAAACGVVGLKPSFGEISTVGVFPLSGSLDHVGPLARNVADAWILHDAMRGHGGTETPRGRPISGLRLGRLTGYFLECLDAEVRVCFDEALARLTDAGAAIFDLEVPHAADTPTVYINIVLPEAAAHHAKTLEEQPEKYSAGVLARLEMGREIPADDYVKAQRDRATLGAEVEVALAKCDALVLPTLPIPAPPIGATFVMIGSSREPVRQLMLRLTQLFNLTGHPAISLPCGHTADGLPCGFQLVGRRHHTSDLLSTALACERSMSNPAKAGFAEHNPPES